MLVLEKLPTHPQAKLAGNKKALNLVNDQVNKNLKVMEELKPKIRTRNQRYKDAIARRQEERDKIAAERTPSGAVDVQDWQQPGRDPVYGQKRTLEATEHGDLALKLAHNERRKRRSYGTSEVDQYDGLLQRDASSRRRREHKDAVDDLSKSIIAAGKRGQQTFYDRNAARQANGASFVAAPPQYPSVPRKTSYDVSKSTLPTPSRDSTGRDFSPAMPPALPPKERDISLSPPPLPSKVADSSYDSSPVPRSLTATPDISSQNFTFKPAAFTEDGTPLRTIFLPSALRPNFLSLASSNTATNREFLGILCGTLISNAFFISKLVIPEQEATSDTCEMVEEGEVSLWEYCDTEDLMTLGWIHTHPTQTCFMSSRDLHTHSGYQAQMIESVAIVCAPRHDPSYVLLLLLVEVLLTCCQVGRLSSDRSTGAEACSELQADWYLSSTFGDEPVHGCHEAWSCHRTGQSTVRSR